MYSSWSFVFCLKSECTQIRHFLVHLGKCWSVYDVFEDTVFRQSGAGWNGNRGNVNYVDFRGWITKSSLYCFCLSLRRHFKVFPSRNSSARLMTVVEKSSYILRHDIIYCTFDELICMWWKHRMSVYMENRTNYVS